MNTPGQTTAVVTGAGSGIGRAVACRLAASGVSVVLVGRTRERLDATSAQCQGAPLVLAEDLTADGAVERIIEATLTRYGGLDVLVNNAGQVASERISAITRGSLQQMLDVNFIAPTRLIVAALPFVRRIVNVSSAATADPFEGLAAYAAAKSALESITRSIHTECADRPVRGFSVAPAAVETAMLRSIVSKDDLPSDAVLTPDAVAAVIVECALGRRDRRGGLGDSARPLTSFVSDVAWPSARKRPLR